MCLLCCPVRWTEREETGHFVPICGVLFVRPTSCVAVGKEICDSKTSTHPVSDEPVELKVAAGPSLQLLSRLLAVIGRRLSPCDTEKTKMCFSIWTSP